ncbi:hypothetical protein CIK05_12110 [Bdellovibrio sp. qaytius]|nr:hypothetical protein CIK05_12110 [Bdellovibrio sp. qaytius]
MLKILSFIGTFLFGKRLLSIPYEVIVDYAIARVRGMAQSVALGFAGIVLILTGFLVSFFNVLSVYDDKGYFMLSAVAGGGLGICVLGAILIMVASYKKHHPVITTADVLTQSVHSPIEEAVASLITEFINNRKEKHAAKEAATGAV